MSFVKYVNFMHEKKLIENKFIDCQSINIYFFYTSLFFSFSLRSSHSKSHVLDNYSQYAVCRVDVKLLREKYFKKKRSRTSHILVKSHFSKVSIYRHSTSL